MTYSKVPNQNPETRYRTIPYKPCGNGGLRLPILSLGSWYNFGSCGSFENCRNMICHAFNLGITNFDLANNYGPPPGVSEEIFSRILKNDLSSL